MRPLGEERTINRNGLLVIYRKEMADHIHSRRFFIVLCLILITSFASIYAIRIHADRGLVIRPAGGLSVFAAFHLKQRYDSLLYVFYRPFRALCGDHVRL